MAHKLLKKLCGELVSWLTPFSPAWLHLVFSYYFVPPIVFVEPDRAVSAYEASSATLLKYAGQSKAWRLKGRTWDRPTCFRRVDDEAS